MTAVAGPDELDALAWHALTTTHAHMAWADDTDLARRYDPEVTLFAAIRNGSNEAWAALANLVQPGEVVLLSGRGPFEAPDGWTVVGGAHGDQMVLERPHWRRANPEPTPDIVTLTPDDVPQMLALVAETRPGPFRSRTIELGRYVGVFAGERLIAMAGERLQTPRYGEISAVCVDPSARGRGLAAALTRHVATAMLDRGQTPVLHVEEHNHGARRVYERLGFVTRLRLPFVAVRAPGAPSPTGHG